MPFPAKYTREQREKCFEMFWEGRRAAEGNERPQGKHTLKEIEKATGVPADTAWRYARGKL